MNFYGNIIHSWAFPPTTMVNAPLISGAKTPPSSGHLWVLFNGAETGLDDFIGK